jgi:RimJ/RimL family protein N-acetyltransferase
MMFSLRKVLPFDRDALTAIASRIWEGADYLPFVFDDWISDPTGEFTAAILDGRVVGCAKLTFLTPTDAWFEGLRKDPALQEKGLAAAVSDHFLSILAGRMDLTSIRFSTYFTNISSIRANERNGFRRRATFSWKMWTGAAAELRASLDAVRQGGSGKARAGVETITDESAIFDFIESAGYIESSTGLILEGWRAYPYSRDLLASRYVRKGLCRGVMRDGEVTGLSVVSRDDRFSHVFLKVPILDAADPETAGALLDDIFLQAAGAAEGKATGKIEIDWMAPPGGRLKEICAARGFRSDEQEDDLLVFELPPALLAERSAT